MTDTRDTTGIQQVIAEAGCRPLVLIDIENLVAGQQYRTAIEARISELAAALPAQSMVRVAAHPTVAPAVWFSPGSRAWRKLEPRRGQDASDRALLETLDEPTPASCDSLVIGSGDHVFIEAIRVVGLPSVVISLPECLSARLAAAADRVAYLSPLEPLPRRCQRPRRCSASRSDLLDLRDQPTPYGRTDHRVSVSA